jgi:hypothetical protein
MAVAVMATQVTYVSTIKSTEAVTARAATSTVAAPRDAVAYAETPRYTIEAVHR